MEGRRYGIAVIGGGASGITAAISAKKHGANVMICEKTPRIGRKILASGNGRCNLSNDNLDSSFYNSAAQDLVGSIFKRFGRSDIDKFFEEAGLATYSDNGRIFPITNQSASVLKALDLEIARLGIPVDTGFDVTKISPCEDTFILSSRSGKDIAAKTVIIACGGKSYPALGSDGSGFKLAESLGHSIVAPAPAAVPVVTKDPLCHQLQGQRIPSRVKSMVNLRCAQEASGDLLFTKYGLSGTSILDISESISIAINRDGNKRVSVEVDMVPFMERPGLEAELARRIGLKVAPEDVLVGILPNKFAVALRGLFRNGDAAQAADALKKTVFRISATRGWNEAEFTAGGVPAGEVTSGTLESRIRRGIYFAGEVLDVNGIRGGYNLAWAWASGAVAGEKAASCAR